MENRIKYWTVVLAGVGVPFVTNARVPERPNIIWIMAEDMGQDLACYGMKGVRTPNLDKMAREGMLYNAAVCTSPISSPSRSAMITGVHQEVINAHNHRSNRDSLLNPSVQPITWHLRNSGYTCILGDPIVTGGGGKTDCNFKTQARGEWDGKEKFGLFDLDREFSYENQPFFAQIQLVKTHRGDWWKTTTAESEHPVDPATVEIPPYMPDHPKIREEWASYLDQVEYMDMEVGLILQELKEKGLYDNTILFFIGDNGRCDIRGKGYLYEPGLKIPMIVWGKGVSKGVIEDVVSTLDISATILDLAGCDLPEYLMGKPLLDKETGKFIGGHEYVYSARDNWDEVVDCMRAITTRDFKYIRNYMPETGWDRYQQYLDFHRPAIHVMRTLRDEEKLNAAQMLFMAETKPVEELYDLQSDPHELVNLADNPEYAKVLEKMRSYLQDWQARNRDMGLEDLDRRNPEKRIPLREYVQSKYPEDWKKLTQGEICDSYKKYTSEFSGKSKKNK